jgi:HSP20 family protein
MILTEPSSATPHLGWGVVATKRERTNKKDERKKAMSVRDLIPWNRGNNQAPTINRSEDMDPFMSLHRNVNRLFDEVFRDFDTPSVLGRMTPRNGTWPSVEFSENDKEIRVVAEMPGLDENDVEVLLEDGVLTLRGEKKSETEDKDRQFSERYYGRFERRLALGREVEEDKVEAAFKNGVLTVTLPKTEKAQANAKRITINTTK